jgi:hypothetical protein
LPSGIQFRFVVWDRRWHAPKKANGILAAHHGNSVLFRDLGSVAFAEKPRHHLA